MPATLTSVADPSLTVSVHYTQHPQRAQVADVTSRMWDRRTKPEVHRGTTDYTRWTWTPIWPASMRSDAEAFVAFLTTVRSMADARFTLEMPAPVGSNAGPWVGTVECVNPEIAQDVGSQPMTTQVPVEFVEAA